MKRKHFVRGRKTIGDPVIWQVEYVEWDAKLTGGQWVTITVEASSAQGAARLAGEGNGFVEIQRIVNAGPTAARERKGKAE